MPTNPPILNSHGNVLSPPSFICNMQTDTQTDRQTERGRKTYGKKDTQTDTWKEWRKEGTIFISKLIPRRPSSPGRSRPSLHVLPSFICQLAMHASESQSPCFTVSPSLPSSAHPSPSPSAVCPLFLRQTQQSYRWSCCCPPLR